jgi:hypothetical protein
MGWDKMDVLLTIRRRTIDQSRQALAGYLRSEADAREVIRAIDVSIPRERALADHFPERPDGMQIFGAWLERARARRLAGMIELTAAEKRTAQARSELAEARSAARAVERTIEDRKAAAQGEAEKRDQHAMDDITRGRRAMLGPMDDHGAGVEGEAAS